MAVAYALTATLSLAATFILLRWENRIPIVDVPNQRSSHSRPKSRAGGIAIFIAFLAGSLLWPAALGENAPWVLLGGVAFFLLGLLDDLYHLNEGLRFCVQVLLAVLIAAFGPRLSALPLLGGASWAMPPGLAIAVTAFWYTGFINLFNFMDGTDGLAAGEAVLAGIFMSLMTGSPLPLIVSASALGFLYFNRSPSRIFMGDSGSYLLGFLLAVATVIGCQGPEGLAKLVAQILVLGTFIADTTATLLRRIVNGETWYKAHRSHYYQKLSDLGFSHGKIFSINLALTGGLGASGLIYLKQGRGAQTAIVLAWLLLFAGAFRWIQIRHRRLLSTSTR